jgi:predicted Rdx family selenoprotein
MQTLRTLLIVTSVFSVSGPLVASESVFWLRSSGGTIWEANLDGSNAHAVISGANNPMSLALDTANNALYWADRSWGIRRANTDGTGQELIVPIENLSDAYVAVDPDLGKVFWLRSSGGTIWEANLDGSNAHAVISGANNPMSLALDTANNALYWADRSWGIRRANTDGTGQELIVPIENLSDAYVAVTPEPATLSLLALGGAAVMARRKRRK